MSASLGPSTCRLGCREVEFGLLCSDRSDVVPTGDQPVLHPAEQPCTDTVVHRSDEAPHWHTTRGTTADFLRSVG